MNETTLQALINLFALFSAVSESRKEEAIRNFTLYLHAHLGIASSGEYLALFSELLELYGVDGEPAFPLDMNSQARTICTNIRGRLEKEEQVMVFLRFLELAKSRNPHKAKDLIDTVARVFEIDDHEVEKFRQFIFRSGPAGLTLPGFLSIDSCENEHCEGIKHICEKKLDGEILFLDSPLIRHFIFILTGNEDLTLEGNPILPGRFYAFREGGIIRGGRISPIYYTDIASAFVDKKTAPPFIFSGEALEFKFPNSNNGLHRFDFSEHSGQLIAVMGGSGVGKSTLLNILNGNILPQNGKIAINGHDIHVNKKETEGLIGYVPQDDLLFGDLTVWENLHYNARLCFDELPIPEIDGKVTRILHELELFPYKDLKVGSPLKKTISGGQRKRLNVALELIREPAILFVDEPTSGLSSTDSEKVMLLLKHQTRQGRLIIVNIHQPSSAIFKLFDKLWILDQGGRPIYTGNPLDAILYFKREVNHVNADICECSNCGNVNPEQVLEIVETKMIDPSGNFTAERRFSPEFWHSLHKERVKEGNPMPEISRESLPRSGFKKPSLGKQFRIFFERNFRIKVTDRQYVVINLLEAPILAAIVAWFTRFAEGDQYIFFENKSLISYLFMSIVVVLFMGMSISAEEIVKDRKILQRESFLNLSRFSYLNSKVLLLLLLSAFQALTFVWVGNLILGIHGMNFAYWLVLFSVALFSNLLGLNISSAFDSVVTIYILLPLLLIPQILLCGVIVKFDDLQDKNAVRDATPVVGDLMVSRWAFEALAVEQFSDNRYMTLFFDLEKEMAQARFRSDLLTTELTGLVDMAYGWKTAGKPETDISGRLTILRNEIEKLERENERISFPFSDQLTPALFSGSAADSAKRFLARQKRYYKEQFSSASKKKDLLVSRLSREHGDQWLVDLKMKYHNKSLETLLLNREAQEFFRYTPEGIMQKIAPVYKDPEFRNGRAHFLAPQKNFMGFTPDTYWFNVAFIGFMCIFLYVALYFDWLRKLISR
jgi:ABC-type multidrug transport system ATPase subunit